MHGSERPAGIGWRGDPLRSVDVRTGAVQSVADSAQDGRVDVVAVQVFRPDPGGLRGFGVGAQLTAGRLAVEAHVDRHPDLAVREGDAVPGIAEDADQPRQLDG